MIGGVIRVTPTWDVTARRRVVVYVHRGRPCAQHQTVYAGARYVLDGYSGARYTPKYARHGYPDERPHRGRSA